MIRDFSTKPGSHSILGYHRADGEIQAISYDPIAMMQQFDAMILAGYKLRNRLEDVP